MRKIVSLLIVIVFSFTMIGCETMQEHKGAATGAGIGAAVGATAGALLGAKGAKTETAIIGGLIGALVGGAVGHYTYDTKRTGQETAQKYNYQPTMGTMLRLEDTFAVPATVKPGDKVDLKATYAVLGTAQDAQVNITEIREIRLNNDLVGKPEITVTRSGGTYTSTMPLILPSDAKKGTYHVITTVQAGTSKDSRETTFVVK